MDRTDADSTIRDEDPRWSAVKALVISGGITVAVLAAAVVLLIMLSSEAKESGPETALSLVFVAAAVVLILVVCTLTIVFKRLRLSDPEEPMGLPRGSIRAVIALLLIMLFFIAALFLFNSTRESPPDASDTRQLTAITAERLGEIPTTDIRTSSPRTENGTVVYDVVLYPRSSITQSSNDLAKQLVTTLATLVTAIAAFYFGANSVSSAMKEAPKALGRVGGPGDDRGSSGTGAGNPSGTVAGGSSATGAGASSAAGAGGSSAMGAAGPSRSEAGNA